MNCCRVTVVLCAVFCGLLPSVSAAADAAAGKPPSSGAVAPNALRDCVTNSEQLPWEQYPWGRLQWIANAIVVLFFPVAFNQIGKAPTFFFLAAMALVQVLFTWRFVPETKGRTLEEIENLWNGPERPR